MFNPFILKMSEQFSSWKSFRNDLTTQSEMEQLQQVANYWAQAPLRKCAYDIRNIDKWPSTWEMIANGNWCECSVAVGMESTLRLSGWSNDRLKLRHSILNKKLFLEVDSKYLLNCHYKQVDKIIPYANDNDIIWIHTGINYKKVG